MFPEITDVAIMKELLEAMGVQVRREGQDEIDVPSEIEPVASTAWWSGCGPTVVLGLLLARIGRAKGRPTGRR